MVSRYSHIFIYLLFLYIHSLVLLSIFMIYYLYLNNILFSIKKYHQNSESSTKFMDEFYIDKIAIIQSVTSTQCTKKCGPKVMLVSFKMQYKKSRMKV